MRAITDIAIQRAGAGFFTRSEVVCWAGGSPDRQFALVRRAIRVGEVIRIHRGLYCLAPRFLRRAVDPLALAQHVYGPSYISLETALSYHGWIPEAVHAVTSVSLERSREFASPVARFSFTRVPQRVFYAEVTRVETSAGESFLLASPLKALADYVYARRLDWRSARPVIESLRVDETALAAVGANELDRLAANYASRRVRRFLAGMRKDLAR